MSECYGDGHGNERVRNGDYRVPAGRAFSIDELSPTTVPTTSALYICRLTNGAVVHVLHHAATCAASHKGPSPEKCDCLAVLKSAASA